MDFNFVTPHLATGAGIADSADVEQLAAAGITHVIDCRDDFDDAPLLATHPAITYLWNGTADDGAAKPVEWFQKGIAFALSALAAPPAVGARRPKVYAHCAAGHNRGPSTAFAILLALQWSPDVAETKIRAVRPQVTLAYKQDAMAAATVLGFA